MLKNLPANSDNLRHKAWNTLNILAPFPCPSLLQCCCSQWNSEMSSQHCTGERGVSRIFGEDCRALNPAGSSDLAVMQGSGYYQRGKTRWKTLYWIVREIIQRTLTFIPWHSFAASSNEGADCYFSRCFFFQFFPYEQISALNIVPPPWPVLRFLDLVRKWHHNSNDSTDIIFRLTLSVLYFSLTSSCVIHHLPWHLFFAAQFQGQIDDLFSLLKFEFVGVHQYPSLNTLLSYPRKHYS